MNLAEIPATITGVILLVLKELIKEKARSGMNLDDLLNSAIKQTGINEERIKSLLSSIERELQ